MRIIGGKLKGMALSSKVSKSTRPTSDAVRETIFNLLQTRFQLIDSRIADLFAGTGALGIECLSRGSKYCTFVDTNKFARKVILSNLEKARERSKNGDMEFDILSADVSEFVVDSRFEKKFDLVFADPPYEYQINTDVLNIVASNGLVVYETSAQKLKDCENLFNAHPCANAIEVMKKIGQTGLVIVRVK